MKRAVVKYRAGTQSHYGDEVPTPLSGSGKRLPAFKPYKAPPWRTEAAFIDVTIDQVRQGIDKMIEKNPDWSVSLKVASVLLDRLEAMRVAASERSQLIDRALDAGDAKRAQDEAEALFHSVQAPYGKHGMYLLRDFKKA